MERKQPNSLETGCIERHKDFPPSHNGPYQRELLHMLVITPSLVLM